MHANSVRYSLLKTRVVLIDSLLVDSVDMAKGKQRKPKAKQAKPKEAEQLPEDMYDEIDDFHRGADKVSLGPRLQEESDADMEDEDEAVYNLGGEGSDFEDSDDSEAEDELEPSKGRLADRECPDRKQ